MLRQTEDIAHKVEGCQDLVQLSPPLPSVSAAMASSTGLTLPVALVATGAVVGTGATTAMTAPVATRATPRPSTRRVWRAYVHDHPRRARRPSRARCPRPRRTRWVRCAAASPRSALRIQPDPYEQPHVPVCAACVCAPARLPVTLLSRTVAGRCRGRPGCTRQLAAAGLSPGYLGPVAVLGLDYGPRNAPCSGPSMRHRPLGAATPCARARACRWCVPAEIFGLWRVCFPPCLVRPGRRLPVQGLSEGSLGFRDRLPAWRGPGTGLKLCHQGYQRSKRNLVYGIWSQ